MIPAFNVKYLWNTVVGPRVGSATHVPDAYAWGGSFSPTDINQGTDCSGAAYDELAALLYGPAMSWPREFYTGTFAGARPGDTGPFGGVPCTTPLVCIAGPDAMPDAAMIIAVNQNPDPSAAHMIAQVGGVNIEMGGQSDNYHTSRTDPSCADIHDDQFNQWFALPGDTVTDTLFADVSEFQVPVDDSYPYPVLSIRVCDGTYQDHNFAANYAWMRAALDSGKLVFGIIYTYVRPSNWLANAQTVQQMIDAAGGLHPRVALMLDVESGDGNGSADQSAAINALYNYLAGYAGDSTRIIGYGNVDDLNNCWPSKPPGIRLIVAGYGDNPDYPGKVAHQYTDGIGYGGGLPEGAPPFGHCDMNSADGLDPDAFAAACGVRPVAPPPPDPGAPELPGSLTDREVLNQIWDQLRGPQGNGWPQLGGRSIADAIAALLNPPAATPLRDRLGRFTKRLRRTQ